MSITLQPDDIRTSVSEYYAGRITAENSCCAPAANDVSCCGEGDVACGTQLYNTELIQTLPMDISGLSMGCGDPVTIASLNEGETVVDLGSGAGMDCFLAARQVGKNGQVIGVDMTDAMLDKANANRVKMGFENVEFRKGYIESMPIDDNTADVIMSNCVINLSPQKASVFSEIARVLKPGGRVAISDIVTEGEFSEALRNDTAQWSACVTGAIDAREYTALMEQAGLVDVQVVDKIDTEEAILARRDGMPRIFSARITGKKPV